tara:strand:- start:1438 stop:1815 length:378 start_codon:yes stop_codon:yes gene_type:complete
MSDVLLTNHKDQLYAKIEFDLESVYQEKTSNFIYNGERITKFNFEEFASDTKVIDDLFESIIDEVWHMHEVEFANCQALTEEAEYFGEFASKYLYNLLDDDLQEHRESEKPSEESEDNDDEVYWC